MKPKFIKLRNYLSAERSINALTERGESVPGLGAWIGAAGRGKTTAANIIYSLMPVFYIVVERLWRPRRLLEELCEIMNLGKPEYRLDRLSDQVAQGLLRWNQPVLIDEADYLLKNTIMVDVIRDLHDKTSVPFILIGMERLHSNLQKYEQFFSRILPAAIVEFQPVSPSEISLIVKEWTGLDISNEAAEKFRQYVEGDFRYIVGYLHQIENACKVNKLESIDAKMIESVFRAHHRKIKRRLESGDFAKRLIVAGKG